MAKRKTYLRLEQFWGRAVRASRDSSESGALLNFWAAVSRAHGLKRARPLAKAGRSARDRGHSDGESTVVGVHRAIERTGHYRPRPLPGPLPDERAQRVSDGPNGTPKHRAAPEGGCWCY